MLTGPMEAAFLGLLLSLVGARRVLELGTFTGYSALAMAERLPAGGEVVTIDLNPDTTKLAKSFWAKSPHGHKIKALNGPGLEVLKTVTGKFDLAFIDADKENYLGYFKRAQELMSMGGVIVLDNMLWSGRVLNPNDSDPETAALRDLNSYLVSQPQLEVCLLPVRDGMMLVRHRST